MHIERERFSENPFASLHRLPYESFKEYAREVEHGFKRAMEMKILEGTIELNELLLYRCIVGRTLDVYDKLLEERREHPQEDLSPLLLLDTPIPELPSHLSDELREIVRTLSPLLKEGYRNGLHDDVIKSIPSEGRGIYRVALIQTNGESVRAIVYIKGAGSKLILEETEDSLFPGFPNNLDHLFFDNPRMNTHPRITGTETGPWGMLEFLALKTLFKRIISKYQIESVSEAIRKGIPIPIGIQEQADLSVYLQRLLSEYLHQESIEMNATWIGNFLPFVTVAAIVPGNKRMSRYEDGMNIQDIEQRRIFLQSYINPEYSRFLGRIIREQISLGAVFSKASSHRQNIYDSTHSAFPIADYSDLLFLGTLTHEERMYSIYATIERELGIRPLHEPITELNVSCDDVLESNAAFWEGIAEHTSIRANRRDLSRLSMIFPKCFEAIIAEALLNSSTKEEQRAWDEDGSTFIRLISERNPTHLTLETYERRKRENIPPDATETIIEMLNSPLMNHMRRFIDTGDQHELTQPDSIFRIPYETLRIIEAISDSSIRNSLMERFIRIQRRRNYPDEIYYHDDNRNLTRQVLYLFEERHFERLQLMIQEGNYERAEAFLEAFENITAIPYDNLVLHPADLRIPVVEYYSIALLSEDERRISQIQEEVMFFRNLYSVYSLMHSNAIFHEFQNDEIGLFNRIKARGLPHPTEVFIHYLTIFYQSPRMGRILEEIVNMWKTAEEENQRVFSDDNQSLTPDELYGMFVSSFDEWLVHEEQNSESEEERQGIRILRLLQICNLYQISIRTPQEVRAENLEKLLEIYEETCSNNLLQAIYRSNRRSGNLDGNFSEIRAKMYELMGYKRLAKHYRCMEQ